jgi:hypothetical protein
VLITVVVSVDSMKFLVCETGVAEGFGEDFGEGEAVGLGVADLVGVGDAFP